MKYIDTSAFVKYYSEESTEKGSDRIKELIDKAKGGEEILITSIMLIGESVSVFDKWLRLKLLEKEDFTELLAIFTNDIKELTAVGGLVLEGINILLITASIDYIVKYGLSLNDSLHLLSALLNKKDIEEFICSDKQLLNAANKEGLRAWNPED